MMEESSMGREGRSGKVESGMEWGGMMFRLTWSAMAERTKSSTSEGEEGSDSVFWPVVTS